MAEYTQITVYIRQDQLAALQALIGAQDLSLDELIQEAVDLLLRAEAPADPLMQTEAAEEPEQPPADALDDIIGIIHSDVGDWSVNHDKYLDEIFEEERQRWQQQSS